MTINQEHRYVPLLLIRFTDTLSVDFKESGFC